MVVNLMNNKYGFSLVEAMVGLGLMTAVGVGVMKLQTTQVKTQKKMDADYEINTLSSVIYNHLKSNAACDATIGQVATLTSGAQNVGQVIGEAGAVIFSSTQANGGTKELFKGKNDIEIEHFIVEPQNFSADEDGLHNIGQVRFAIAYKNANPLLKNNTSYKKYLSLPIRVKYLISTGAFDGCVTSGDDVIQTTKKKFCESINGIYDATSDKCVTADKVFPTPGLTGSQSYEAMSSKVFIEKIWPNMIENRYLSKLNDSVMTGDLVAGTFISQVQLPTDDKHAMTREYMDAQIIGGCSPGEIKVYTSNGPICRNLMCNNTNNATQEYLVGINSDGSKICNRLLDTTSICENGGGLAVQTDGSVTMECCTPSCSNESNYCSGTQFNSDNNCGFCTGTKGSVNATWSSWADTGEYRDTSACVDGQIQREKKQTRTCSGTPECGGSTCSGSNEQWVTATPSTCTVGGKCKGYGTDTSAMFVTGASDTGSCGEGYRYQYFDIVSSEFQRGNIYTITRGQSVSEEVKPGDTTRTVLDRLAAKINGANISATGACGTSNNYATVQSNTRIRLRVQWQHSAALQASRSCNNLDETTCGATNGCNWDTGSANYCTGWNYSVPQGTCNGTYYRQACAWDGFGPGSDTSCQYGYYDQASCQSSEAQAQGCYWGSVSESCYASSASACSALGGSCSWKSYPEAYRSCTATSSQSTCTGDGAGVCTWGP